MIRLQFRSLHRVRIHRPTVRIRTVRATSSGACGADGRGRAEGGVEDNRSCTSI